MTADDLLDERRPIEEALAAWIKKWDAYCLEKGYRPDVLRPIETVLRERNAA